MKKTVVWREENRESGYDWVCRSIQTRFWPQPDSVLAAIRRLIHCKHCLPNIVKLIVFEWTAIKQLGL